MTTEERLLNISRTIGRVVEMNGPATDNLARYLDEHLGDRSIYELTVAQFLHHIDRWKYQYNQLPPQTPNPSEGQPPA